MYKYLFFNIALFLVCSGNVSAAILEKSIETGQSPADIVFVKSLHKIYVSNAADATVTVINTDTDQVIKTIQLSQGSSPSFAAVSHDDREVYVAERLSGKVSVIETLSDSLVARIDTHASLINGISISPDDKIMYVASAEVWGEIRMSIIDLVNRVPINYFDTTDAQDDVVLNRDGTFGFIGQTINGSNPLVVYTNIFDTQSNTSIGYVQDTEIDVISSAGDVAWGHNYSANTVSKVNLLTKTITDSVSVAARPSAPVADDIQHPKFLFVANDQSKQFTIIDTETLAIREIINLEESSNTALVDKDNQKLYMLINVANKINVYNLQDLHLWSSVVEEKDAGDLVRELIATVKGYEFAKHIDAAYMAHLKKIIGLLEHKKYTAAENQIESFISKLKKDLKQRKITKAQYDELVSRAREIDKRISNTDVTHTHPRHTSNCTHK